MVRARAKVTGRVQGVSFRMYTLQEAARLRVVGWVRNEDDGSVLIEVQGEQISVERLLEWSKRGPSGARVVSVDIEWITPQPAETSFRIQR